MKGQPCIKCHYCAPTYQGWYFCLVGLNKDKTRTADEECDYFYFREEAKRWWQFWKK